MGFKHLVISGGGPTLIQTLGSIYHLNESKHIDLDNIETIYATSAGAFIAIMLCLKFEWDIIKTYIINRPWEEVFDINLYSIYDSYNKKGIFDNKTFEKCVKPLFDAKNVDMNITVKEFYELTKIEIHFFTFEINEFEMVDVSFKTFPDYRVLDVLQMTCALPVIISPVCINEKCFIDGGIYCNYPLYLLLENEVNPDEVIGFKNVYGNYDSCILANTSLIDYILKFVCKLIYKLNPNDKNVSINNEVICNCDLMNFMTLKSALSSQTERMRLFNNGIEFAKIYLDNKCKIITSVELNG
jgi:predicted acylesterase/phospholipase RssA